VDLRGEDRASGCIEGAVHEQAIDTLPFKSRVPELCHRWADKPLVIFTCQYSAHRAPQCANWYREKAHPRQQVGILSGGFRGWESLGLPVIARAAGDTAQASDSLAMQLGLGFISNMQSEILVGNKDAGKTKQLSPSMLMTPEVVGTCDSEKIKQQSPSTAIPTQAVVPNDCAAPAHVMQPTLLGGAKPTGTYSGKQFAHTSLNVSRRKLQTPNLSTVPSRSVRALSCRGRMAPSVLRIPASDSRESCRSSMITNRSTTASTTSDSATIDGTTPGSSACVASACMSVLSSHPNCTPPQLSNAVPTIKDVEHLDPVEVQELMECKRCVLVDVRGEDRAAGIIEGSVHEPAIDSEGFVSFPTKVSELVQKWKDESLIIFTCQYSAHRAPQCANWYREKAPPQQRVAIMSMGFRGWEGLGFPVQEAAPITLARTTDTVAQQLGRKFVTGCLTAPNLLPTLQTALRGEEELAPQTGGVQEVTETIASSSNSRPSHNQLSDSQHFDNPITDTQPSDDQATLNGNAFKTNYVPSLLPNRVPTIENVE